MTAPFAPHQHMPALLRKTAHREEDPLVSAASSHRLIQLQQSIGNSGVRALLAKQGTPAPRQPVVQRLSGDDEESDGGSGSWFDQATETVGGWFGGGESDSESGGGSEAEHATDGGSSGSGTASAGGSEGSETEAETGGESESESGGGLVNEVSGGGESGESEGDEGGGLFDWLPDLPDIDLPSILGGEADEDMPTGEIELPEIETVVEGLDEGTASCISGHGDASGGGVTVAGKTSADFQNATAAASLENSKVTSRKDGAKKVHDVTGTIHIDYALPGEPTVAYIVNPPKSQLSECKLGKVDAFIAGDLGAHEAEHVTAFKTFNGGEDHTVSFTGLEANSTAELTQKVQAEVDNFVKGPNGKVKARQKMAQAASDAKDNPPWSKPIPGISSCP